VDFSYNNFSDVDANIISKLPVPANAEEAAAGLCLQCIPSVRVSWGCRGGKIDRSFDTGVIDFSHNNIRTDANVFQLQVNQWPSLISFKINNNKIAKPILLPSVNNQDLKTLDLSNNQFNGSIPPLFSGFTALVYHNFYLKKGLKCP
jgi:hypothetical protein